MRVWFAIILLLLLATPALAGDFWKEKPYQQWTKEEVRRVLTESPWARSYTFFSGGVSFDSREGGDASLAGRDRPEGTAMGGGIAGMSRGPGSQPEAPGAKYFVVWSSAATVRKALARQQLLRGDATPDQIEQSLRQPVEHYAITLIGSDLSALATEDPQALRSKVFLRPKRTRQKFLPDQAQLQGSPDDKHITAAIFVFPRRTASGESIISTDEKVVEFGCELKSLSFKVQFDPRAMRVGEETDM